MIHLYKDAIQCKLKNRKTIIFKESELIRLHCIMLQEVPEDLDIKIFKDKFDFVRVFKLKNKKLVYRIGIIRFSKGMFELISHSQNFLDKIE